MEELIVQDFVQQEGLIFLDDVLSGFSDDNQAISKIFDI